MEYRQTRKTYHRDWWEILFAILAIDLNFLTSNLVWTIENVPFSSNPKSLTKQRTGNRFRVNAWKWKFCNLLLNFGVLSFVLVIAVCCLLLVDESGNFRYNRHKSKCEKYWKSAIALKMYIIKQTSEKTQWSFRFVRCLAQSRRMPSIHTLDSHTIRPPEGE